MIAMTDCADRASILVVEDEWIVANDLKESLADMGYEVCAVVHSGEEAVAAASRLHPDLALMDVMLGRGMDGIEAAGVIGDRCGTPVIYLSAYADEPIIRRAKATHPYGYVLKPYAERELAVTIEMALAKHRLETKVRRAKKEWEATFDTVPDCIAIIDSRFKILRANQAMRKRLQLPYHKLVGRTCYEILHDSASPPSWCPHAALLQGGTEVGPVEVHSEALGGWFQVTVTPLRKANGAVTGCVHVARDITRLKKAQEELTQRQQFLQAVVDSVDDALMVISPEYDILLRNRAAEAAGYKGTKCFQCSHGQEVPCQDDHPCPLAEVRATNRPVTVLHRHEGRDGGSYPVEISAAPMVDSNGEFIGIIEVARDVSEREEGERQRRLLTERLFQQQKEDAVCRLTGGIAHQYNNLLMSVLGNVELLEIKYNGNRDLLGHTGNIRQAADRMAALTRQMMLYANKDEGRWGPVSLSGLLVQVLDLTWGDKPETVEVERRLADDLWLVEGDQKQLVQLLIALIVNGYEAMAERQGRLLLTTQNVVRDKSWCCQRRHEHVAGEYVQLTVSDSGVGIATEDLEHVFEPFFSRKFLGRGLGLAVADSVVQSHRGCLTVESRQGCGTTMQVLLPRHHRQPVTVQQGREASGRQLLDTVLIVDDEKELTKLFADLLKAQTRVVLTATSGEQAMELFAAKKEHIQLVLLDVQLNGISGLEVFRAVRNLKPEVAVLLMSGHERQIALGGMELDAHCGYLQKPCAGEELYGKIAALLDKG